MSGDLVQILGYPGSASFPGCASTSPRASSTLTIPMTRYPNAATVGTTIATGLFMAPTAYHRIRFREGDKERMLRTSNRFAIVGIGFLAVSVTMAVVLTADLLFGLATAAMVGLATFAFLVWVWFAIPVARKVRDEDGRA